MNLLELRNAAPHVFRQHEAGRRHRYTARLTG
ncbi:hypothetical protein FHX59_005726 [Paraburkholderia silvatlantica]|uniref:Uncharacterized protein n=1 Tax=Paraburkholderia silvatlantica TaxID=321895 RepID=A0ABR6FV14_9BURK|nr:hypothetical protein [Paraburkholderia silvatlantica]PVY28304.1 hypothetical protein C7411_117113 [Paraburkholderia silvatlantica]PXW34989.1 hypothetical protein C7413_116113 [Paraburkholderia silvatlantica]TDQ98896.1 hypothetical protein C7412_104113 [Paraburkholderia silvatlantica]